ncbi:MAG: DUF362 domain-containing protein [Acidobacteriota bacterium]
MKRREFLKQSAAGAAVTVLGRMTPKLIAADQTARVAIVKTDDRVKGIEAALNLISFPSPEGKQVLIKPNFNTADPAPGSTHNDTLRKLVEEMKARGAGGITLGESCGPGDTKSVMEQKGIPAMSGELGFDVVNFDELPPEGWVHCNPSGCHWQGGFDIARPVVDAEYLLWTCCLKTHQFGGIHSMSLKLAVGITKKDSRFRDLHADDATMRLKIAELVRFQTTGPEKILRIHDRPGDVETALPFGCFETPRFERSHHVQEDLRAGADCARGGNRAGRPVAGSD